MVSYNNRIVLDDEYRTIITNLNLETIKDPEVSDFRRRLLEALNRFQINEIERDRIQRKYERRAKRAMREAVSQALSGAQGINVLSIVVNSTMNAARASLDYADRIEALKEDREDQNWELDKDTRTILTDLRGECFDLSWKLTKRYELPDALRLTEREVEQLLSACKEPDPNKRASLLEYRSAQWQAYPPYWYFLGDAYQRSGRNADALAAYSRYEELYRPVFRRDALGGTIAMQRLVLARGQMGQSEYRKQINRILKALPDDGNALIFCAAQYYLLGDSAFGNRLLRQCIDEGKSVDDAALILATNAGHLRRNRDELQRTCTSLAGAKSLSISSYLKFLGAIDDSEAARRLWPKLSKVRACLEWHGGPVLGIGKWNELKVNFPSCFPPDDLTVEMIVAGDHAAWAERLPTNSGGEIPFKIKWAWSYIYRNGTTHELVGIRFKDLATEYTLYYSVWKMKRLDQYGIDELPLVGVSIGSGQIVKP
jgi:hypothetical protein